MIQVSAYGRLTRDTKLITTSNNKDMCSGSIACDATPFGSEEQQTIFYNLTAFNYLAKDLAKHKKGDLISLMGKVTLNVWIDAQGVKQENHRILVDSLVSAKTVRPYTGRKKLQKKSTPQQDDDSDMPSDDIPF
ncbi:MAG: single-stranded DNA-binding protein [gamma proteobacterium symbiont of Taylorina sp.]|nr:single-stranded DNA-binding protein [gamma proteobacterium symbiont of Taylorina sp.]